MSGDWIEYAVIGGYLVLLVCVGFAVRRFNKDDSDYFRNGCRGTWWLVGASAFMQMFSAWTFTGAAGAAYEAGWSVLIIFAGNALGFFLIFLFLGPWFRQLRAVTAPEVIRMRFGPLTQQIYAWFQCLLGVLSASVWLWGLATFIAAVFDFTAPAAAMGLDEIQFVILLTGVIVLAYAVTGGSWAVMATDFLQSLVLLPLTVVVAFLALRHIGGVGEMFSQINEQGLSEKFALVNNADDFPLGKYGLWFAVSTIMYKVIGNSTLITAQKYFGVKDGRDARKAGLLACGLMLAGMLVWFVPPVVARLTMPDAVAAVDISKPAEASYAVVAMALLPTGLTGLMVVAMLSATMSSMDSGLNRNAAVFVRDIYPLVARVFGAGELSTKARFVLGQLVSLVLGVVIIGIALYFSGVDGEGVFELMLDIGALLTLPMAIPLVLALFVRRAPGWSAIAGLLGGLIPSTIGYFAGGVHTPAWLDGTWLGGLLAGEWSYAEKVFSGSACGAAAFFATLPFWSKSRAEYRARVDEFFRIMHTPVDFEAEVGQANDRSQLKIVGVFAVVIGAAIALLALVPGHDTAGTLSILFVSAAIGGTGVLFVALGARRGDRATETEKQRADEPAPLPSGSDPGVSR